ncbi:hypothetical protein HPP92_027484 [Vanilla planifolia]|uniref:Ribosomal eL28/Mak16 domain-containing protein n=1 Tax=Vanilla planifolia TaxID=51239 RepID=A0A835U5F6_VANPL|nr:hypothetical protein HPP92_027484 [Vanilla planifolia]
MVKMLQVPVVRGRGAGGVEGERNPQSYLFSEEYVSLSKFLSFKDPMATIPDPLIWEIVKKNNAFLVKQFGNGNAMVKFSRKRTIFITSTLFKYSGLANKKTVSIQPAGKDLSVVLATTKKKKQNRPASISHRSVMKKEFQRVARAVINQVSDNYYRPDLTKAALARLSAVRRSLQVAKSGPKKRNRQAHRVRN